MLTGGKPEALFVDRLRLLLDGSLDILDIGTSQRFAKELRPHEALFAERRYIAAGFHPSLMFGAYNCDCHQDIEQMTFPDASFDAVICLEVLEHAAHPFQAAQEIGRVLRPGGKLLVTAPFLAQYHGKGSLSQAHDGYPDYWRFTHEGLVRLFKGFSRLEVHPLDGPVEFRLKQFYGYFLLKNSIVRSMVDRFDRPRAGKATTRHLLFGVR